MPGKSTSYASCKKCKAVSLHVAGTKTLCEGCLQRQRLYQAEWRANNRDKVRGYQAKNRASYKQTYVPHPRKRRTPDEKRQAARAYRAKHREGLNARTRELRAADPERFREHSRRFRKKHGDTHRAYMSEYQKKNRYKYAERLHAYMQKYHYEKWWVNRACASRRRAALLQRIPAWADLAAIKEFYKSCPEGMVVDHVVPLRGKNVCGLHVLNNLQYLTAAENGRKSNRYDHAA